MKRQIDCIMVIAACIAIQGVCVVALIIKRLL